MALLVVVVVIYLLTQVIVFLHIVYVQTYFVDDDGEMQDDFCVFKRVSNSIPRLID